MSPYERELRIACERKLRIAIEYHRAGIGCLRVAKGLMQAERWQEFDVLWGQRVRKLLSLVDRLENLGVIAPATSRELKSQSLLEN
jgi:hypothetical protein